MTTAGDRQHPSEMTYVAELEDRLASRLMETSEEVAHTECFDDEQRSEVYAILDALRSDTEVHRATIRLVARRGRKAGHA